MIRIATFLLAAAVAVEPAAAQGLRIDGSSTVYPIMVEAARRHAASDADVRFSGTTAGFRRFCAGETDIATASRPIDASETEACEAEGVAFIELPIAIDAITLVVNPLNTWVDHLTLDELRRIWEPAAEGVVMRWSDVREGWPDRPLVLLGRGQDSGTYEFFTEAVVGEARASRMDYRASEDVDLLATGVMLNEDALAFFGAGGFFAHWEGLRDVAIDFGQGPAHGDVRSVRAGAYPALTRPIFLYVNAAGAGRPEVNNFVTATLRSLPRWVVFTGYMPLEPEDYPLVAERFAARTTGSAFDDAADLSPADLVRTRLTQ